jgi:predicted anti-sigma-YlaC factor YlaD
MKTCKEFCDNLSNYLDGEMASDECHLIEDHLERCPPCALMYECLRTTVSICEKGVSEDMPEGVKKRLKIFLRNHCKSDRSQSREE